MKSALYIQRLFKDYYVVEYRKSRGPCDDYVFHTFRLAHRRLNVTCRYDIMIYDDLSHFSAKEKREQMQARELVLALDALPRY